MHKITMSVWGGGSQGLCGRVRWEVLPYGNFRNLFAMTPRKQIFKLKQIKDLQKVNFT